MPKPQRVTNNLKGHVVFYCKDCEKIVDTKPVGRKFAYRCGVCGTKNVAFGTEKTIRAYYRFKDEDGEKPRAEKKEKPEESPKEKAKA